MQIGPVAARTAEQGPLWAKAQELEAAFLAEMLRHAGVQAERNAFGGGIGEEQFASFAREAQATAMVRAGGIGLAEQLFASMTKERGE